MFERTYRLDLLRRRKMELIHQSELLRAVIFMDLKYMEQKAAKFHWVSEVFHFVQSRKWMMMLLGIGSAWFLQRLQLRWMATLLKRAIVGYQIIRNLRGFWRS